MITGANGTGKTSVLEALAYLGTRRSFRGAPPEALVRTGATSAIIRAEIETADSPTLVEAEIRPAGRSRTRVNRKDVAPGRSWRGRAVHDLLARGPRHHQRGPEGPARPARRRAGPARPRGGPRRGRDRPRPAPAGRLAAPVGRAEHRGRGDDARGVGPAAGRRRQGARGGARTAGGRADAPGRRGLRPPGRGRRPGARAPELRAELGRRPARRAGGQPGGRPAARRQHGRAPPRRPACSCSTGARRAPTPPRASSAAWPWRCAWASTSSSGPGRPWCRRCCSTTCSPSSTRRAAGPWWPSSRAASRS